MPMMLLVGNVVESVRKQSARKRLACAQVQWWAEGMHLVAVVVEAGGRVVHDSLGNVIEGVAAFRTAWVAQDSRMKRLSECNASSV
jgi:hypothetical protein